MSTLRAVLEDPFVYEYSDWLYMATGSEADLDAEALVLPTDDLLPEEIPRRAQAKWFTEILDLASIQDVVGVLQDQAADTGVKQRHKAFLHYLDHDSFWAPSSSDPTG